MLENLPCFTGFVPSIVSPTRTSSISHCGVGAVVEKRFHAALPLEEFDLGAIEPIRYHPGARQPDGMKVIRARLDAFLPIEEEIRDASIARANRRVGGERDRFHPGGRGRDLE